MTLAAGTKLEYKFASVNQVGVLMKYLANAWVTITTGIYTNRVISFDGANVYVGPENSPYQVLTP